MDLYDFFSRFRGTAGNSKRKIRDKEYQSYGESIFALPKKIKPVDIDNILEATNTGDAFDQAVFLNLMLDKEPVISAHIQTRKLAIQGCEWHIYDKKNKIVEDAEEEFKEFGIHALLGQLLNAIIYGYQGIITNWMPGGSGVKSFTEIHPCNVIFDLEGNPALRTADSLEVPFADYIDGQFILHQHKTRVGLPTQQSLLRCLMYLYLYKYYGLSFNARFLEKFGSPFLSTKLDKASFSDSEIYSKTMASLKNAGFAGNIILPEGATLDIAAANAQASVGAFDIWFRYIDEIYAIAILGQTATSKDASGLSKGQAQENVRLDILESDCKAISETITRQLLAPWQIFKRGKNEGLKFELGWQEPEDIERMANTVSILSNAGYKAKKSWIEEKFKIPMEESVEAKPSDNNQPQTQSFSERNIDVSGAAKEEAIQRITQRAVKGIFKSPEAAAQMYRPLTETIREAFKDVDPEDENILQIFSDRIDGLIKKFPALYEEIELKDIESAIQGACLSAMVKGYDKGKI